MYKLTLDFTSECQRDKFLSWFSDGGGEQIFMEVLDDADDCLPVNEVDYTRAFPAWGYNPERDGDPVVDLIFLAGG